MLHLYMKMTLQPVSSVFCLLENSFHTSIYFFHSLGLGVYGNEFSHNVRMIHKLVRQVSDDENRIFYSALNNSRRECVFDSRKVFHRNRMMHVNYYHRRTINWREVKFKSLTKSLSQWILI